ncbi:MAG: hypothetical protein ACI4V1_00165, partial [Eubacteriales bacterium]
MRLNLAEVPFSYRGSYLAFSYRRGEPGERGLYLRTVHGSAGSSYVAKLLIGTEESVGEEAYEAVPEQLVIAKEDRECRLAFADSGTLLFYGNLEVTLDFMNQGTFAQPYRVGERSFWLMNCPWNSSRYMLRAQEGELMPEQDWKVNTSAFCRMRLKTGPSGKYLVVLEENFEDWTDRGRDFSFEEAVGNSCRLLEAFSASMPSVPPAYAAAAKMAAYVDWASFVKPCGLFRREAMLMSKNWMCSVWSWDHCFNALALAYHNPREAWDQFMLMF